MSNNHPEQASLEIDATREHPTNEITLVDGLQSSNQRLDVLSTSSTWRENSKESKLLQRYIDFGESLQLITEYFLGPIQKRYDLEFLAQRAGEISKQDPNSLEDFLKALPKTLSPALKKTIEQSCKAVIENERTITRYLQEHSEGSGLITYNDEPENTLKQQNQESEKKILALSLIKKIFPNASEKLFKDNPSIWI